MKYPQLPVMQCDPGCDQCCGPALCTESEYQTIVAYVAEHSITPIEQGVMCPMFQGGRCAIYPVRPMICRVFGHLERLHCPRGYNRNIPSSRERKIFDGYKPTRCVHELLGDKVRTLPDGILMESET